VQTGWRRTRKNGGSREICALQNRGSPIQSFGAGSAGTASDPRQKSSRYLTEAAMSIFDIATKREGQRTGHAGHRHGSHSWMMMICCVPMLVIAIVLVATGVASSSFILSAIACTVMMAMMMRMMGDMGGK
jgi:cytosine/uracil/thiamine/allantoin permease